LVLGYLDPGGLVGGALKLDVAAARAAIARDLAGPMGCSVEAAAAGMLRLAAANMMRAIRAVSVERGRDPQQFALLAFGGNGGLFAASIARELGIGRVIVPPMPGLFSAFGLLVADSEHHASQSLRMRLGGADAAATERFGAVLTRLMQTGADRLARDGFTPAQRSFRAAAIARYVGQSSDIEVPLPEAPADTLLADLPARFGAEHKRTYGFRAPADEPVELTGLTVIARGIADAPRLPARIPPAAGAAPASRRAWFDAGWIETAVLDRAALSENPHEGPLIVQEYDATCLVPPGALVALDGFGNIVLTFGA
jgi:N-methylhydantoinase A